ncbi:MAG: hypothetical protein SVK44_08510 [Nitrospirota bacterium]|nr:hypothetical protein [Nitrospirota bacterium]
MFLGDAVVFDEVPGGHCPVIVAGTLQVRIVCEVYAVTSKLYEALLDIE